MKVCILCGVGKIEGEELHCTTDVPTILNMVYPSPSFTEPLSFGHNSFNHNHGDLCLVGFCC